MTVWAGCGLGVAQNDWEGCGLGTPLKAWKSCDLGVPQRVWESCDLGVPQRAWEVVAQVSHSLGRLWPGCLTVWAGCGLGLASNLVLECWA